MVIVKNQDLPLEDIEDKVDPPIPFIDSYRRALGEGIDHPELPAGEEIITARKTESRPGTRSDSEFSKPAGREAWREKFNECLACWEKQVDTEEDLDPCMSASHRRYVKEWNYVPGAKDTYFNTFMSDCLNWAKINPGEPMPECEDLNVSASDYEFCINGQILFNAENGNNVVIKSVECGEIVDPMLWQAPPDFETCPNEVTVYFEDDDGRKGCVILTKMTELECCCEIYPEVGMTYTSLQMTCGGSQNLGIDPELAGCPPYVWELSGGGELDTSEGEGVVYTAPETNPGCAFNATIKVTDQCNNGSEIRIAVNCVSGEDEALKIATFFSENWSCGWTWDACPGIEYKFCTAMKAFDYYRCDGEFIERGNVGWRMQSCDIYPGACPGPPCSQYPGAYKEDVTCEELYEGDGCGSPYDLRTEEMIAEGCCPLNPFTGLPF